MAGTPLERGADALLVARAVDGDARAFEVLLRRHGGLMRAYAIRLTGSTADADDVVQEAFITAWNQLDRLDDGSAVRSWLMRIVSRKAIDRIRARRPVDPIDDRDPPAPAADGPEEQAEVSSQLRALSAALQTMPELQRQCWMLKEVGGYAYQQIADEMGEPVSTVRGALARARKTLMREMEGWA